MGTVDTVKKAGKPGGQWATAKNSGQVANCFGIVIKTLGRLIIKGGGFCSGFTIDLAQQQVTQVGDELEYIYPFLRKNRLAPEWSSRRKSNTDP